MLDDKIISAGISVNFSILSKHGVNLGITKLKRTYIMTIQIRTLFLDFYKDS